MKKVEKDKLQRDLVFFMLTPELVAQIYEEVKKAFLRKDGKPFKREKTYWIKNLIKRVAENLDLRKYMVEMSINKLIDNCYLLLDYRNEVYYQPEYLEEIRTMNKIMDELGKGRVSTRGGYVNSLKNRETMKEIGLI